MHIFKHAYDHEFELIMRIASRSHARMHNEGDHEHGDIDRDAARVLAVRN
jgi:hypothetical protein